VPFFFLTGYDDSAAIPAEFRETPRMSKPVDFRRLALMAARMFKNREGEERRWGRN